MEIKTDQENGVSYIRLIARGQGSQSKVAYTVPINESIIADFNGDDELVGVEVLNPTQMSEGATAIIAFAREQGPHVRRTGAKLPDEIPTQRSQRR